jgi:hypothetical protein
MIILKTRFGRRRVREDTLRNIYTIVNYLFAHSGARSVSEISRETGINRTTCELLTYLMYSMGLVKIKERVYRNKQKYLFSVILVRLKEQKIAKEWLELYDEHGNFDKKRYYGKYFAKTQKTNFSQNPLGEAQG